MKTSKYLFIVLFVVLGLVIGASVFTVDEAQRGIIKRLGKFQVDDNNVARILMPGLHFKVPFADTVRFFDKRIQTLELGGSRIPTKEKKELIVDLFIKWRIEDFAKFLNSTDGNISKANRLLRQKTIDGIRAEVGRRNLNNVVSEDRNLVMRNIREDVDMAAKSLGISVIDTRIVRIDLPREVSEAVFELMRTERRRIAGEHRARGKSRAEAVMAHADAQVTVILAKADKDSQTIKGGGDATAARIYADVYSKDPEFYRFYRSLEAYRETFRDKNDMIVLKPDSAFFKYFHDIQGKKTKTSNTTRMNNQEG